MAKTKKAPSSSVEDFLSQAAIRRHHPTLTRGGRLYRAVTCGLVKTKLIPGLPPRYSVLDVDRLMEAPGKRGA